jgi:hypothetical protein
MKKVFLMLLGAMMVCAAQAQIVAQDEAAVVYYSPKTSIGLDFTYTVETYERGIYAQYAEAMLGIDDVVKQNKTSYRLDDARINTSTSVDYERAHKITADAGFPMLLTINEKGLLVGYNYTPDNKPAPRPAPHHPQEPKPADVPMPLPEEVLTATTPQAQAFAAAKQIFHIRETRMYLLSGEVEHAPADGKAMELVLKELDKQERQLVSLFIGKVEKKNLHKHISHTPEGENSKRWDEVLYFSEDNGFTGADNVDADRIRINVEFHHQAAMKSPMESKGKKDKNAVEPSPIVYNLPGNADVEVYYKNELVRSRVVPVAQFGIDVPLPKDLFTDKELPKITFSEKTGKVIAITR